MSRNRVVFITVTLAALFLLIVVIARLALSSIYFSNVLYVTQPAHYFSGRVENIDGNSIVVVSELPHLRSSGAVTFPNEEPNLTPIATRKVKYNVVVGKKTVIDQRNTPIPYLFKQVSPTPTPPLTIESIRVGDMVDIATDIDLRTLKGSKFEPVIIILQPAQTILEATITGKGESFLKVVGKLPTANILVPTEEKEYRVLVTNDTEVSAPSGSEAIGNQPIKYTHNQLQVGMSVIIFSEKDIRGQTEITAARIQPNTSRGKAVQYDVVGL